MSAPYEGNSITNGEPGIKGTNNANGDGLFGDGGSGGRGVVGQSVDHTGVEGFTSGNSDGMAVFGSSTNGRGVVGVSTNNTAVEGDSTNGVGVWGRGNPAGHFEGNIEVTGDVFLTGADCAEEFDVSEAADVEPGIVMVINEDGALQPSRQAYDKRVAGVVSGAGNYRSGIMLDKQPSQNNRSAIALVGKVYCKVDAQYAPIEMGDLLTTSPSRGYAMKATDSYKAFGAVIGKALSSLDRGCGLIPILVTLQ